MTHTTLLMSDVALCRELHSFLVAQCELASSSVEAKQLPALCRGCVQICLRLESVRFGPCGFAAPGLKSFCTDLWLNLESTATFAGRRQVLCSRMPFPPLIFYCDLLGSKRVMSLPPVPGCTFQYPLASDQQGFASND